MDSHGMPYNCHKIVMGLQYHGVMELPWLHGSAMKLSRTPMGVAKAAWDLPWFHDAAMGMSRAATAS